MSDDEAPRAGGTAALVDDDLTLPKATVQKLINDIMPDHMSCPKDSRDFVTACCVGQFPSTQPPLPSTTIPLMFFSFFLQSSSTSSRQRRTTHARRIKKRQSRLNTSCLLSNPWGSTTTSKRSRACWTNTKNIKKYAFPSLSPVSSFHLGSTVFWSSGPTDETVCVVQEKHRGLPRRAPRSARAVVCCQSGKVRSRWKCLGRPRTPFRPHSFFSIWLVGWVE